MASLSIGSLGRRGQRAEHPGLAALGAALNALGVSLQKASAAKDEKEEQQALDEAAAAQAEVDAREAALEDFPDLARGAESLGELDTLEGLAGRQGIGEFASEFVTSGRDRLNAAEQEQLIEQATKRGNETDEQMEMGAVAEAKLPTQVPLGRTQMAAAGRDRVPGTVGSPEDAAQVLANRRRTEAKRGRLQAGETAEAEAAAATLTAKTDEQIRRDKAKSETTAESREAAARAAAQQFPLSLIDNLTPEAASRAVVAMQSGEVFTPTEADWKTPEAKKAASEVAGQKLLDTVLARFSKDLGAKATAGSFTFVEDVSGLEEIDDPDVDVARQRSARLAFELLQSYELIYGPEAHDFWFLKLPPGIRNFIDRNFEELKNPEG